MSHIFLITNEKFYGQKVFPWEDRSENMTSYGNHNLAIHSKVKTVAIYKIASYIQMV